MKYGIIFLLLFSFGVYAEDPAPVIAPATKPATQTNLATAPAKTATNSQTTNATTPGSNNFSMFNINIAPPNLQSVASVEEARHKVTAYCAQYIDAFELKYKEKVSYAAKKSPFIGFCDRVKFFLSQRTTNGAVSAIATGIPRSANSIAVAHSNEQMLSDLSSLKNRTSDADSSYKTLKSEIESLSTEVERLKLGFKTMSANKSLTDPMIIELMESKVFWAVIILGVFLSLIFSTYAIFKR